MKKSFFSFLFLLILKVSHAQKMFIWCPQNINPIPKIEQLKDVDIIVSINDSRLLSERIRNKCTSEKLTNSIFTIINKSYPSANIVLASKENTPVKNKSVKIKINISAYYATFTAPMWFAQTAYSIHIADLRNAPVKESETDIRVDKKFWNVNGYSTAKNNLNKSYIEANVELLDFISDKLNN